MSDMQVRRETASQTAGPYVHIGLAPGAKEGPATASGSGEKAGRLMA